MPPMTGRVIAGRYNLQHPIGRGAMGVVWRARDQLLDRDVAVKEVVISALIGADERHNAYQRTLREARTAARLSHRGVVAVYDVAEEDGRPWIVMELVPSQSLDQVLVVEGRLPAARAGRIGQQLLSALAAAHAAGVLHRDVKPSNVLIATNKNGEGWDERAVLTDFGIAQFEGDPRLTQTGMVMGSPGFTAPERIRGSDASPASDLWSLGATHLRGGGGTRAVRAARRRDHHHVRDHQRGRAHRAARREARPGHRGAAAPRPDHEAVRFGRGSGCSPRRCRSCRKSTEEPPPDVPPPDDPVRVRAVACRSGGLRPGDGSRRRQVGGQARHRPPSSPPRASPSRKRQPRKRRRHPAVGRGSRRRSSARRSVRIPQRRPRNQPPPMPPRPSRSPRLKPSPGPRLRPRSLRPTPRRSPRSRCLKRCPSDVAAAESKAAAALLDARPAAEEAAFPRG